MNQDLMLGMLLIYIMYQMKSKCLYRQSKVNMYTALAQGCEPCSSTSSPHCYDPP
jgi:hypothetical protein